MAYHHWRDHESRSAHSHTPSHNDISSVGVPGVPEPYPLGGISQDPTRKHLP